MDCSSCLKLSQRANRSCFGFAVLFLVSCTSALAQFLPPPSLPRDQFSVEIDTNATKQLTAYRDHLRAGQFAEAVNLLLKLSETHASDKYLEISPRRYLSPRMMSEILAADLPAEALRIYREQVDPLAERIRGELSGSDGDVQRWREIFRQGAAGSLADDALHSLALESWQRGEIALARSLWEMLISPRSPSDSRPLPVLFAYPDTSLDLAEIRARLILCSILLHDFLRAHQELEIYRTLHPNSSGELSGTKGKWVDLLAEFLQQGITWESPSRTHSQLTFTGSVTRNSSVSVIEEILPPVWSVPLTPYLPLLRGKRPVSFDFPRPGVFPVISGNGLFWSDDEAVYACRLADGQPLWPGEVGPKGEKPAGENLTEEKAADVPARENSAREKKPDLSLSSYRIYQPTVLDLPVQKDELQEDAAAFRGFEQTSGPTAFAGLPQFTLTVADGRLYARLRARTSPLDSSTGQGEPSRLIALDILQGEGKLLWEVDGSLWKEKDIEWRFEGTPVAQGGRLYFGVNSTGAKRNVAIACLDADTGDKIWFRKLGELQGTGFSLNERLSRGMIAIGEQALFYETGGGGLASLDLQTGEPRWVMILPDSQQPSTSVSRLLWDHPGVPVWDRGVVYTLGRDGTSVAAVDAFTGMLIWVQELGGPAQWILGCRNQQLVVCGERLWGLDRQTGKITWEVGSRDVEFHGYGRGLLAGNEVWWPMREEMIVVDQQRGTLLRRIPLATSWGMEGGHLTAADGFLLISRPAALVAFPALTASSSGSPPLKKGLPQVSAISPDR